MSKFNLLFLFTASLLLAGCEAPELQVTVTSTKVAVTQASTLTQILSETIEPSTTPSPEPTSTPEYDSIWDPDRIRWAKLTEGTYNGVTARLSVEIDFSIYERPVNALVGFEEAGGTWEDVGNTYAAAISMLQRAANGNCLVEINMELHPDGTYTPLDFNPNVRTENTRAEFDCNIPIRFIFFNGDGGISGRVFPWKTPTTPSRGLGVDPETHGLLAFMGMQSLIEIQKSRIYSDWIPGLLTALAGASNGGTAVLDQEKNDTIYGPWRHSWPIPPIEAVFADE